MFLKTQQDIHSIFFCERESQKSWFILIIFTRITMTTTFIFTPIFIFI
jgi:hypothetical protein